jgi:hypothetical protein
MDSSGSEKFSDSAVSASCRKGHSAAKLMALSNSVVARVFPLTTHAFLDGLTYFAPVTPT